MMSLPSVTHRVIEIINPWHQTQSYQEAEENLEALATPFREAFPPLETFEDAVQLAYELVCTKRTLADKSVEEKVHYANEFLKYCDLKLYDPIDLSLFVYCFECLGVTTPDVETFLLSAMRSNENDIRWFSEKAYLALFSNDQTGTFDGEG
jgi:hypothetical protein